MSELRVQNMLFFIGFDTLLGGLCLIFGIVVRLMLPKFNAFTDSGEAMQQHCRSEKVARGGSR